MIDCLKILYPFITTLICVTFPPAATTTTVTHQQTVFCICSYLANALNPLAIVEWKGGRNGSLVFLALFLSSKEVRVPFHCNDVHLSYFGLRLKYLIYAGWLNSKSVVLSSIWDKWTEITIKRFVYSCDYISLSSMYVFKELNLNKKKYNLT